MGSVYKQAIEMLLASMYWTVGPDGLNHQFGFKRSNARLFEPESGASIFFRQKELVLVGLFVRQHGPNYLRSLSLDTVKTLLTDFIKEHFGMIANEVMGYSESSFAETASAPTKVALANSLATSPIFQPINNLTLFPMCTIRVEKDFVSKSFILVRPESFPSHLPVGGWAAEFNPTEFPPIVFDEKGKGRVEYPSCWLGVYSPTFPSSKKMAISILSAASLVMRPFYRYTFSGRKMFGGRVQFEGDRISVGFADCLTPPLMNDIVLGERDAAWLDTLAQLLTNDSAEIRKRLSALEYFYKAWPREPAERFAWLSVVLDALYGREGETTKSIVDGILAATANSVDAGRVLALVKIRNSVIHGGAPDVYDSSKYAKYYAKYGADPILDLELVTAECLRSDIFGKALRVHPEVYVAIIREAKEKGRIAPQPAISSILPISYED